MTRTRHPHGSKRDYPKIDIHQSNAAPSQPWIYACSTTWSATCREAVERYADARGEPVHFFKASFAKEFQP